MKKLIATLFAALISSAAFAELDNATLGDYGLSASPAEWGGSTIQRGERTDGVYQNLDIQ